MRGRSAREIRETNPNSKEDVMTQSITAKNVDTDSINAARSDATTAALLYTPQALSAPPDYVPLTPDGLLVFCQKQLRDLDTKIQSAMTSQQGMVATESQVSDIEAILKQNMNGPGSDQDDKVGFQDPTILNNIDDKVTTLMNQATAAGNTALATSLKAVHDTLHAGPPGDCKVTKDDIKDMCTTLDSATTDLRSGAELSMITLQSLISQRATALQLTTGMMSSMNDGSKAIAGNIGH
jgi:hypothetical protein